MNFFFSKNSITTDESGCANIVGSIGSAGCHSPTTNTLLIEGTVVQQEGVARTECQPALFSCVGGTTSAYAQCNERIDVGKEVIEKMNVLIIYT